MFCFKAHLVARGPSELSHLSRTSRPASSRGRLHVEQDQERTCFVCRVQHLAFLRADTYGFGDKHANKQKKQKHSNVCKKKRKKRGSFPSSSASAPKTPAAPPPDTWWHYVLRGDLQLPGSPSILPPTWSPTKWNRGKHTHTHTHT